MHIAPTRDFVLEMVRTRGARAVYGPDWPHSDAKTIARLEAYPYTVLIPQDCDHHDADGHCLGHDQ